jgi:hypothetical protein
MIAPILEKDYSLGPGVRVLMSTVAAMLLDQLDWDAGDHREVKRTGRPIDPYRVRDELVRRTGESKRRTRIHFARSVRQR